jgi:hypothetical protein
MLILLHRVLDSMHLGFICQSAYHYLVTNWGYAPALGFSTWELDIQLIFIGLSSFVCQLFFLNRCIPLHPKILWFLRLTIEQDLGFQPQELFRRWIYPCHLHHNAGPRHHCHRSNYDPQVGCGIWKGEERDYYRLYDGCCRCIFENRL